jgi:hypothetical protein
MPITRGFYSSIRKEDNLVIPGDESEVGFLSTIAGIAF